MNSDQITQFLEDLARGMGARATQEVDHRFDEQNRPPICQFYGEEFAETINDMYSVVKYD